MQAESVNSNHSARPGRIDGPPRQAQREMPRLSTRHSFSHEASSRRKKIFCLCILCWLILLCLTGIIIIAVVHFQSSDSDIDQISAGALIGFGVLLIVVLGWSAIVYAKFQKGSSARRADSSRTYVPREEMLAFASSEMYTRGASTISTNNSISHSDSSNEGINRRFIYREPHHDDERRVINPANTRFIINPPGPAVHRSTRMLREYHERTPGVARPQVLHFPERPRVYTDPARIVVEANPAARHFRRHSNPLPPPYQPPTAMSRPLSESLPMGFPPPAYDRVVGRRRSRLESTASEESSLFPPDYQSTPPSPSALSAAAPTERRTSLNVPPDQSRIDLGIHISSTISSPGRTTRVDSSPCQAHQSSRFPTSGMSPGGSVMFHSPSRLSSVPRSATQVSGSAVSRSLPHHHRQAVPRIHSSSNSPSSPQQTPMTLASRGPESPASPIYLTNNRSPFSRPILALTAPENTIQESVDHEEQEENDDESRNDTSRSANQVDQQAPNVVLVYLSQSQEEEIIV